MECPQNRRNNLSKTYRVKSLPAQLPTSKPKTKIILIDHTTLPNQSIEYPEKDKRRVATEMTQKYTTTDILRSSCRGLKAQDIKEQFYLINLCKKLQTTTFKLKNTSLNPYPFQFTTKNHRPPKKINQTQKKSIKRSRQAHNSLRYATEATINERQTLKNRMKALQMTQHTFFT